MLRGATPRAEERAGTAVLRMVVSSDSMKKATATSHGNRRLEVSEGTDEDEGSLNGPHGVGGRRLREGSSATHMFAAERNLRHRENWQDHSGFREEIQTKSLSRPRNCQVKAKG